VAAALVLALLAGLPRWWSRVEPLDAAPDYRIPYASSEDYWLYERHVRRAAAAGQVIVLGDSVIWGEYVAADQTLSHFLDEQAGSARFANGGLNGTHPLALAGLVRHHARSLSRSRVLVHCNLLWMSSPERDLQVDKELPFNHPQLVPQFVPHIPSYKATVTDRLGIVVDRTLPFRSWVRHLRIAALDGQDLHRWSLEHPWSNPWPRIRAPRPANDPPREAPVSWLERGIQQQDLPWIDLEVSLQWQAFAELIKRLGRRDNELFILVSPLNERMLTAASLQRYRDLVGQVERWLGERGIAYSAPPPLPSPEYADASHPLAPGYARLAGALAGEPLVRQWLEP
jgi:hypothetical protein